MTLLAAHGISKHFPGVLALDSVDMAVEAGVVLAVIGETRLGILPTVELDVTEVRRSGKMEVAIEDWYYLEITNFTVNGLQVLLPAGNDTTAWANQSVGSDQKAEFEVVVPRDARLGEMQVVITGTTKVKQDTHDTIDKHKQTVTVGVFDLTVTPSTAVTDQVVRVEGSGFLSRKCIVSIMVGEQMIAESTSGKSVIDGADCVTTDSSGKFADSFAIPFGLEPGDYNMVVTDSGNRVGEHPITIPEPMIELDPAESQRGDTVTVIGSNFPAEDLITVTYKFENASRGMAVASATTDTVGKFRATFTVPITAPIGATHEVIAQSENKADGSTVDGIERADLNAEAEHNVPDETLEISPETVASGGRLTIIGGNLPLFTPVSVRIGGIDAAGRAIGEDDASDGAGRYEKVILVPQLTPGTHTVELQVHARGGEDISVARFVVIADIVTRPTVEVFADLITAGQLSSVWRYSIDEDGSDWDSFDPQFIGQPGINDLELVSTDDIVWIRVTENVADFQGSELYAGWNLRTLE